MKKVFQFLLISILFMLGINSVYALDVVQEELIVKDKSSTINVIEDGIGKLKISPKLEFNEVGDYITYKLVLKNNDSEKYKVESIIDNNLSENIKVSYNYSNELNKDKKEILITIKYEKEISDSNYVLNPVNINIKLSDEKDNTQNVVINPKTLDNIFLYIVLFIISFIAILVLTMYFVKTNKIKKGVLGVLVMLALVPVIFASSNIEIVFNINFENIKINIRHKVEFDTKGGNEIDTQVIDNNEKAMKPSNPEKTGYNFIKWLDEENKEFEFDRPITKDVKLTALWEAKEYTIKYELNGGALTTENPTKYTIETPDFKLNNPTKEKNVFKGWTGSNGTTSQKDVTITKGTIGNLEYEAMFNPIYTVTYDVNGGNAITQNTFEVENGEKIGNLQTPTKDHYEFDGWYIGNNKVDENYKVESDITLTAKYTPKEYTITYKLNGGINNSSNPSTYTIEKNDITLQAPTKTGNVFKGWTGSNGTTKEMSVTIQQGSTGDKEYTANWNEIYTVTFNVGMGSATESTRTKENGETIGTLPIVTEPTGYDFVGWYVGDTKIESNYVVENDITLVAVWKKEEYTVTFNSNGGSAVESQPVKYEEKANKPTDPTRTNYVFRGWKDSFNNEYDFNTPVTGNITLKAEWQVAKSTLNLTGNQMITKMKQLAYPSIGVTNGYNYKDTKTTGIVFATEQEYNAKRASLTSDNTISTSSSLTPTYMWYDSNKIYIYTEADKVAITGAANEMFSKYSNLTDISALSHFDVSGVTDMNRMFQENTKLTNLTPLKDWNVSNVTNMAWIFGSSSSSSPMAINDLTSLKDWNVSNVRSFQQGFKYCTQLTSLNGLQNWNVSGVQDDTSLPDRDNKQFNQMFNYCTALADASAITGWDVRNATDFGSMFNHTDSLTDKPIFTLKPGTWEDGGTYVPN